jgi:hypothetical protein
MTDSPQIVEVSLLPADDGSDDGPERRPRRRSPLVGVLAGAIVLALVAAGVLASTVWRDRTRSDGQADAVALVEQYTSAFDAHDLTALRATLSDEATFSSGEDLYLPLVGPFSDRQLDDFYRSMFRADVHLTTDGPVQVTGTGPYRVVVVQTVHYTIAGVHETEQAVSLFTLLQLQDRPVVLDHVWWRPPSPQAPSMLWAQ